MLNRYGVFGLIYIVYCVIRTKLLFSKAKIIRFPVDLRGRQYMEVGKAFTTGQSCRLEVENIEQIKKDEKRLVIGNNVQLNDFCHITAAEKVHIGNNVLIASKVYISDVSHGAYGHENIHSHPVSIPKDRPLISIPVYIEDNVWLGDGVCVLPGTRIGKGAIIGSNAVVTKDIPPATIAVGIPAKPIKKFNFQTEKWEKIK